ncbi:MAG: ABC transporter ATP-binding protein/permease [Desulfobacteraceae bacterium]|nr:ABC transporter ATP-binding protein/permease [Desulfobacteraceae bacterium]
MKLLLPYFKKNFGQITLGIVCMLIVDGVQLTIPAMVKQAVDMLASDPHNSLALLKLSLIIILLGILMTALRYWWRILLMGSARNVEKGIRKQLFAHILTLDQDYYDKIKTGDIMAHATSDINHIRMAFGFGLIALTDALLLGSATIGIMLYLNVKLTLYALIPMPMLIIITRFLGKKMHSFHGTAQESFSSLTEIVRESFFGIRIIKVFNFDGIIIRKVQQFSKDYFNKNLKRAYLAAIIKPFMFFVFNLSTGIILFYGGYLVMEKALTPGELVAFIQYLSILAWPMIAFGWVTNLVQRGLASLKRVNALLDARPDVCNSLNAVQLNMNQGMTQDGNQDKHRDKHQSMIEFNNVDFSYNRQDYVLKKITLEIKNGTSAGITGPPGSGKTSFLGLIIRLYNCTKGHIYIDMNDMNDIDLASLRDNIAYAPQESFLFSGTIRENIIMGKTVSQNRLDKILKACMLEKTISAMPKGVDTIVGERGVTLSGGQKQRIALARTLIQKKPIIILDDPVSQMDTDTASEVIKNINILKNDATLIIVSHRIAALTPCDKIYILNNGKIEDAGTHENLIKQSLFYKNAYTVQLFEDKNVS